MIGLKQIPSQKDLLAAYNQIQSGSSVQPEPAKLALWSQWTRFDPRLGELLVEWFARCWTKQDPIALNAALRTQPWPAAIGPILETAALIQTIELELFRNWLRVVMTTFLPAPNEQFFIGLNKVAGPRMIREAGAASKVFRRWGFLSSEVLLAKGSALGRRTLVSPLARLNVLNDLLAIKHEISVNDYLFALNGLVSRRQAERDLAGHPGLRARGFTRRRTYTLKAALR